MSPSYSFGHCYISKYQYFFPFCDKITCPLEHYKRIFIVTRLRNQHYKGTKLKIQPTILYHIDYKQVFSLKIVPDDILGITRPIISFPICVDGGHGDIYCKPGSIIFKHCAVTLRRYSGFAVYIFKVSAMCECPSAY